jgi:hypothetical protein
VSVARAFGATLAAASRAMRSRPVSGRRQPLAPALPSADVRGSRRKKRGKGRSPS